jgi:hypothetical protein
MPGCQVSCRQRRRDGWGIRLPTAGDLLAGHADQDAGVGRGGRVERS